MIRREAFDTAGQPLRWILISQPDHARLSGQLAEAWGEGPFAPLEPRDELLWAIFHHDDGWRAWEARPGVDPQGKPRSFTEMELPDALAIWTDSIENAFSAGPLQGYLVAGHFCALARRAGLWRTDDPQWPLAEEFLNRFEAEMQSSLQRWQAQNPAKNTPEVAQLALRQLQFFDLLSLWFCCTTSNEPERLLPPDGPDLVLSPRESNRVELAPWPFRPRTLEIEVAGRAVPAGQYRTREELAAASSQPIQLRWKLVPGGLKV